MAANEQPDSEIEKMARDDVRAEALLNRLVYRAQESWDVGPERLILNVSKADWPDMYDALKKRIHQQRAAAERKRTQEHLEYLGRELTNATERLAKTPKNHKHVRAGLERTLECTKAHIESARKKLGIDLP